MYVNTIMIGRIIYNSTFHTYILGAVHKGRHQLRGEGGLAKDDLTFNKLMYLLFSKSYTME